VSFGISFAQEARNRFKALEPWLQEQVLDLIDDAAMNPSAKLRGIAIQKEEVLDLKAEKAGFFHYVFVTVEPDAISQTLRVKSVGSHVVAASIKEE
jgi:hypothetical protein